MPHRAFARLIDSKLNGLRRRWGRWTLPDFANAPQRLNFELPRRIVNPQQITVGNDCYLGPNSTLCACGPVGRPFAPQQLQGKIVLGDRVWGTHGLQIYAAELVEIASDVMIAGNVFICDYQHGYETAEVPYKDQAFHPVKPIRIGAGSWIGQNVVVMPGVEIGRQAIVGANSVVTKSIPSASIAVGVPARVIRRYDADAGRWTAVCESEEQ